MGTCSNRFSGIVGGVICNLDVLMVFGGVDHSSCVTESMVLPSYGRNAKPWRCDEWFFGGFDIVVRFSFLRLVFLLWPGMSWRRTYLIWIAIGGLGSV